MRKCEAPTNPECFAEAVKQCAECEKWFCLVHSTTHEDKARQLQQRIQELEEQNKVLLKRAEDAEAIVAVLSTEHPLA